MLKLSPAHLGLSLLVVILSYSAFAAPVRDIFIRDSEVFSEASVDYLELREIALRIFAKCPPSECLYVGIGQSPTPLLALLEAITDKETAQVPLSDVRQLNSISDAETRSAIDHGMQTHLAYHLDPKEARKILVTDFAATTGASMAFAYSAIKKFLPHNEVYAYAMSAYGPNEREQLVIQRMAAEGIEYWHLSQKLYDRIHERRYRSLQRSTKYNVMKLAKSKYEPAPNVDSDRFALLVDAFRDLAQNDLRLREYTRTSITPKNTCRYLLESPKTALLRRQR